MLNDFRPPEWHVIRDGHPLRPFVVVRHGESVARFAIEWEAFDYIDRQRGAMSWVLLTIAWISAAVNFALICANVVLLRRLRRANTLAEQTLALLKSLP